MRVDRGLVEYARRGGLDHVDVARLALAIDRVLQRHAAGQVLRQRAHSGIPARRERVRFRFAASVAGSTAAPCFGALAAAARPASPSASAPQRRAAARSASAGLPARCRRARALEQLRRQFVAGLDHVPHCSDRSPAAASDSRRRCPGAGSVSRPSRMRSRTSCDGAVGIGLRRLLAGAGEVALEGCESAGFMPTARASFEPAVLFGAVLGNGSPRAPCAGRRSSGRGRALRRRVAAGAAACSCCR